MSSPTHIPSESSGILDIINQQKAFFKTQKTLSVDFRVKQLKRLKAAILNHKDAIHEALYMDLRKSEPESYMTETGTVLAELEEAISHTKKWAKPRSVPTPLFFIPGSSKQHPEPYGNTLIIGPWNYPFQLLFAPLIGAVAAGNTAVCKPSEYSVHTTAITKRIINDSFEPGHVAVVEGGVPESTELLRHRWDYVFFTGSTHVGRIVYLAAAKHLTPVTLELGGKSPCIVDKSINVDVTASRLVWGKFLNVGQTCIAPDYLLVHEDVKGELVAKIKEKIKAFYGDDPKQSEDYGRIINTRNFDRLRRLMDHQKIIAGGQTDRTDKYIAPTLLDHVTWDDPVMQEEIFGPILPIMTWKDLDEVIEMVNSKEKPLALYVFSNSSSMSDKVIKQCPSGGASVNDTIVHIANGNLPFGGVGESGIGAYHGQASFDTFSHLKSVLHKSYLLDLDVRYAPWGRNREKLKFLVDRFL